MSKTIIYFIRHGESQANKRDAFIGHTDLDLTKLGHQQAQMAAEYLKDIPADVIYASDLKRAYNTAMHTAEMKGMNVIKNENLREIYAGKWEDKTFNELENTFNDSYSVWLNDIDKAKCPDGETVEEMKERVVSEVMKIAEKNIGKTVFIFSHGTPIRAVNAVCKSCTLKDVPWATNASITKAEYTNGKLDIVEYANDSYLGDMITYLPDNV